MLWAVWYIGQDYYDTDQLSGVFSTLDRCKNHIAVSFDSIEWYKTISMQTYWDMARAYLTGFTILPLAVDDEEIDSETWQEGREAALEVIGQMKERCGIIGPLREERM